MSAPEALTDDALLLGGVYTDVEKTIIELQKPIVVRETRSDFQRAMQHKFIEASHTAEPRLAPKTTDTCVPRVGPRQVWL